MQGKNGDAERENGLMDIKGEGEDGANSETSTDILYSAMYKIDS